MGLHVVLGGGAVGRSVIGDLKRRNLNFRAVDIKEISGVATTISNVLNIDSLREALQGAEYVYVCLGLPYKSKVWEESWPVIMTNIIEVCSEIKAKIVYLDNVYLYGPPPLPMNFDETTSQITNTRKGLVRKKIADQLMQAHATGKVRAVIGRSADFYGPYAVTSVIYQSFLERMLVGKNPQFMGSLNTIHSYAYVDDVGRALVALALDDTCYGEVWHIPTASALTIEDLLKIFNKQLNADFRIQYISKFMKKILSVFIPIIKEVEETLYQYEYDFVIDHAKFTRKFPDFKITPHDEAVMKTVQFFQNK